ncbi:MAG: prepilin peptidase [Hasllibacter sp.]
MDLAHNPYVWLFLAALPFCGAAIWTDLTAMKIRNWTVLGLAICFGIVGAGAIPFSALAMQVVQAAIVLVVCFGLTAAGAMGAGDAKFLAATALYVPLGGASLYALILFASVLAGFALHRGARMIPALKGLGWESWTRSDFPMGLVLGSALAIFLAVAAVAYGG